MNLRASALVLAAAAALTGCSGSDPADSKDELIAADKAFSAMSAKEGPRAALLAYVTPDAKLLSQMRQGKDGVADMLVQLPPTATLSWEPSFADVGSAGDLGYTWGRYTLIIPSPKKGQEPVVQMGNYVTVWRRKAIGGWKVVLDGTHPDGQK
jgi:ketosteroid isomerase-like protein